MYMSNDVANRYQIMQNAIRSNIDAIRSLLKQADELSTLIKEVQGDDELKKKLTDHIEGLHKSIDHLIDETDKLFKQYIELANSVVVVS